METKGIHDPYGNQPGRAVGSTFKVQKLKTECAYDLFLDQALVARSLWWEQSVLDGVGERIKQLKTSVLQHLLQDFPRRDSNARDKVVSTNQNQRAAGHEAFLH
jgi:hypothetical protein